MIEYSNIQKYRELNHIINHIEELPAEVNEVKMQRYIDRYAASKLKNNGYWLHNKILRNLADLYGLDTEIKTFKGL
jgi:hypothetical protein